MRQDLPHLTACTKILYQTASHGVSRSRPPLRLPNLLRQLLRHPFYPLAVSPSSTAAAGSSPRFLTERSSEDMLIRSRLSRSRHRALLFAEDEALVEDPGRDDDEGQGDDHACEPADRKQVDQSLSVMRSRIGERSAVPAHRC